jgi:hypothetical protein
MVAVPTIDVQVVSRRQLLGGDAMNFLGRVTSGSSG